MKCPKTIQALFIALVSIACAGCFPQITWLPDSSGFIYTVCVDGQRLMHFDLATKKQHILVADTQCQTLRPAVSPDGKRIAVARITHAEKKPDTWQVLLYDLAGKLVRSSTVFTEPGFVEGEARYKHPTEVFWGPANTIVINELGYSTFKTVTNPKFVRGIGVYDLEKDQMLLFPGHNVISFGGTPFRPDGKGFIVVGSPAKNDKNKNGQLSLMDKQGNSKPIAINPPLTKADDFGAFILGSVFCDSFWQGNTAAVTAMDYRLQIDTDKLEATFHSDPVDSPKPKESILIRVAFSNGRQAVQIVSWSEQIGKSQNLFSRLEVFDTHQKKARVLSENADGAVLFPSPNRKYIAVRWVPGGKEPPDSIWLIDEDGKIVDKIK